MVKSVAFILGSPRRMGNTNTLARKAMQALAEAGVQSVEIDTARLGFKYPGCAACYKCQNSENYGCHIEDELAKSVATLADYDAIVLATPLFWFSYPAQIKMFIDRMFSMMKFGENGEVFSLLKDKPMGMLATAGGALEQNLDLLEAQWRIPVTRLGNPFLSCLFPLCHYPSGGVSDDPEAMGRAAGFGKKLAGMLQ